MSTIWSYLRVSDGSEKVHFNNNEDFNLSHHAKSRLPVTLADVNPSVSTHSLYQWRMSSLRPQLAPLIMQKKTISVLAWTRDPDTGGTCRLYSFSLMSTTWSYLIVSDDSEKVHFNNNEDFSLRHLAKSRLQLLLPCSILWSQLTPCIVEKTKIWILFWINGRYCHLRWDLLMAMM